MIFLLFICLAVLVSGLAGGQNSKTYRSCPLSEKKQNQFLLIYSKKKFLNDYWNLFLISRTGFMNDAPLFLYKLYLHYIAV